MVPFVEKFGSEAALEVAMLSVQGFLIQGIVYYRQSITEVSSQFFSAPFENEDL